MLPIIPMVLCGGSGTRLWPLSRELYPKQFIPFDDDTLFGKTLDRVAPLLDNSRALVVCNEQHRFFASGIVAEKGYRADVILEPCPRNTAPAIAMAALAAQEDGNDALLLVMPSDHVIEPQAVFLHVVQQAMPLAEAGDIVTFGIAPTHPETGYGYIQRGKALPNGGHRVARFMEKPSEDRARELLQQGDCTWNAGIFLFRASTYLEELARHAPAMHAACLAAWAGRSHDALFVRPGPELFAAIPADSIDYAIMEHTDRAAVMELALSWNDLGSWNAFYESAPHDDSGNAIKGDVLAVDCEDCYLHATSRLVATLGLKGLTIMETPDAVLVMDQNRAQDVKTILAELKTAKRPEANLHLKVYRPWGSYEVLAEAPNSKVKRITVNPGQELSLQLHYHRAEHWVVVNGTALVTQGEEERLLHEDESVYIPLGVKHRLQNPGCLPLQIIEVQTGSYLGEDDIVRFEDVYGR